MKYYTRWKEFNHRYIERIRWMSADQATDFRDNGSLLIHFTDNQSIHNPIMYGWFVLIKSVEPEDSVIGHIVSGIIPVMRTDRNDNLLNQLSNVMNLDDLEQSLLIRIHGIVAECSMEYGIISEEFTPELSCSLLAYLLHRHRGRDKSDCWDRASATHSSVTPQDVKDRFNSINHKKVKAMKRIVSINATTSQSELPKMRLNN